jgi:Xaa-Pro aminopeptidase
VLSSDDLVLGTDGRYGDRARAETAASGARVIAEQNRARLHQGLVSTLGAGPVQLDGATVSHSEWGALAADVTINPATSPVKRHRRVKDDAEIARIAAAANATDAALREVEPALFATVDQPVTEADIRNELEYRMRLHGADDRSYDTIVASGPDHAARPHHEVGSRTIVEGDTVVIDVGALVDGYHSDMTRSYVIGQPTGRQRELYELVGASQRAGLAEISAGTPSREVDRASREVFVEAGFGEWYLHGTGHGVGLQIHESPFHFASSDETLLAGDVVTVEPGLYRVGFGGFRIEDLVVVTDHGHRLLTHAAKNFTTSAGSTPR